MKELLIQAKSIQDDLVKYRRQFHANPELSSNLPKTTTYVKERLVDMGYEPKDCGDNGILAIAGKKEGKVFLIRGDMDALPINEETNEPFKSTGPNMHACGHDLHTAMLLGAAKLLKDNEDLIEGKVKLMFQPAEETLSGAKSMIEDGILENPKVDAAMMIHVTINDLTNIGNVLVSRPGVSSASSDAFRIEIQGRGGHGARPFECLDPLNPLAHIYLGLQEILAREIKTTDEIILSIGQLHGGNASNIIPDTAFMEGSIRCFNEENRTYVKTRIEEIATNIAKSFRCGIKITYPLGCPVVKNDENLFEEFIKYTSDLLPEGEVVNLSKLIGDANAKSTGSEDFGYISQLIPTIGCNLVVGTKKDGYEYKLHHPKVKFNEDPLHIGSAVYANMAIEWLKNNA